MSPHEFILTLNQYALDHYTLLAIGLPVAVGLLLWRKLRKIEGRLGDLRREMDQLNLAEERRLLISLSSASNGEAKSERAESNPSIVPEISDNNSANVELGSAITAEVLRAPTRK
jgi:hypothetical protein